MVASIDATVVGIALPAIGHSFRIGLASLQWVVTAYTVTLAGLLLGAGALGDRYGRRRVFLTGVVWFAVASTLCAIAPGPGALIAARVLQGIGAALLTPGSPAILEASFHPADRSRAIGAWSGLSGVGTAIGPFLGGWLVEAASWRLVFLINLPVAAAVVALSWRHVPESRALVATGRADLIGGALATVGLMGVTYALIEGASSGWVSPTVLAAFNGGAITLAVFLLRQPRVPRPLLPPNLFSSAQFSAVNRLTFIVYGALGGVLFLLPIDLQQRQ
jgi:EmrB/QacA subfamily drug resistance transporter